MSACREFQELLSLALDHPLTLEDQARLVKHLSGCAGCCGFQEDLAQAHRLVRGVETVEPPPWMASKIMARILAETAPKPSFWRRAILPLLVMPQVQVATVLLICATTYYLVDSRTGTSVEEVMRDIRPPQAEPAQKAREAESAAMPSATQPRERLSEVPQPVDQAQPREGDTSNPRSEETELKKDKSFFAPPPTVAPGPVAATPPAPWRSVGALESEASRQFAPKSSISKDNAADGSITGGSTGRDDRAVLSRASKKVAASAPERTREEKEEKQDTADQAAPILVQWEPDDPARARQLLEQELANLGATILPEGSAQRQAQAQRQSVAGTLSAHLEGRRLTDLVARLGHLGTVRSSQARQQGLRSGQVTVQIQW